MKIACYTSCSINYLAKARVLVDSLKRYHADAHVVLLLNDSFPEWLDPDDEQFDEIWTPSELGYSENWVFKHNVMELCTAVKGRALVRLLENVNADLYAYFDPDVCVYDSLDCVDQLMKDKSIGLVPHITEPETTDIGVRLTEMSVTHHGIYNLGHLFVRNDEEGRALANWWDSRLNDYCYNDPERGLFTDQRWMDLVPAVFESVQIIREPIVDVASWNVRGRAFSKRQDGKYTVNSQPLLTYHFSGTGANGVHNRIRNIFNPCDIALAEIERNYEIAINYYGQEALGNHKFAFDYFDNGVRVTDEIRKFYRKNSDLELAFPEPYSTENTSESFYHWLCENRVDLINRYHVADYKLEQAFDGLFDETYYLSRYSEVKSLIGQGIYADAKDHYIQFGSKNFYNPNLYFDSSMYFDKAQYHSGHEFTHGKNVERDIEQTLLWHYLKNGLENALEPNSYFDSEYYLKKYDDVKQAIRYGLICTPLEHFFKAGDSEMRQPNEETDTREIHRLNQQVSQLMDQAVTRGVIESLIILNKISGYETYDVCLDSVAESG